MHLTDYLIEKNILTKMQILEVLAYQQDQLSSLFRLALSHSEISEENLFKLAAYLGGNRDFVETVRREAFLSEKDIRNLLQLQGRSRIPFGQALINMNLINHDQLKKITFEFSSLVAKEAITLLKTAKKPQRQAAPETILEITHAISSKIPLPDFQFKTIDPDLVTELGLLFDERKKTQLETEIMRWPRGFNKEALRDFYRELHTLKGTARFLGAFVLEFLIHHMENLLSDLTRVTDLLDETLRKRAEDLYLRGFDFAWELRTAIVEDNSEERFSEEMSKQRIENYINSLSEMQTTCLELESRGSLDSFKGQF